MHKLFVKDIINICNGNLLKGNENTELISFSKDTRTLEKKDVYIGIKGDTFNGNTLYKEALNRGAIGCILDSDTVVDLDSINDNSFIILVNNTIECIQKLASYKRDMYDIPVIAITGSVGKTSTKDIVYSVLSEKYNVLKTEGNYNNHIGLPLTILRLKDENCMVLEMGMSHLNEISVLSKIAKPTLSIITNIGTAHIGNLGSRENILKAKLEILDGMDNKYLIINNDNDLLHNYYESHKDNIITFGITNKSDYNANNIKYNTFNNEFDCIINNQKNSFIINTPGDAFVYNALCGIAVGCYFNIDIESIKKGLFNCELSKRRMEITKKDNITIINDAYNASFDSVIMAINYLKTLNGRKIAILGDILELGTYSEEIHKKIAGYLKDNIIDIIITVGNYSKLINEELNKENLKTILYSFSNNKDAINKLKEIVKNGDNVLLKASNGMNFIEIYNNIIN